MNPSDTETETEYTTENQSTTSSEEIEVNPALFDDFHGESGDSDYYSGGYGESGTTSLFSSAYNYEFENGRRYHSYRSGKYLLPNDELEQERLDLMHYLFLRMLEGALHISPVSNRANMKVLDLGTGTGVWAIDFADAHPSASVIGTDLSPIQPLSIPVNCRFEIDDAESEWTYPDNHFDFIHIRQLAGSIQDWPRLIEQAYRCLKPGGWLEIAEMAMPLKSDDGTLRPGNPMYTYGNLFAENSQRAGLIFHRVTDIKQMLEAAGYVEIKEVRKKLPMGPWPADRRLRDWGMHAMVQIDLEGLESHSLALFTRYGGLPPEEAVKICREAKDAIKDRRLHCYVQHYWFAGRKSRRARERLGVVEEAVGEE